MGEATMPPVEGWQLQRNFLIEEYSTRESAI